MNNSCMALAQEVEHGNSPEECRARAGFYRLLAGAFIEEPGESFLAALRSETTLAALADVGVKFDNDFLVPDLARLGDTLACEYTALFASSGAFPPVESVRRQGGYQQAAHTEVTAFYRHHGFTVIPGRFPVFEDQLGAELQFAAALLEGMAEALDSGDAATARYKEKELKRFWAQHLGLWVRGYAQLIERATEHSFYREMAGLLHRFSDAEVEGLGLNTPDQDGARYRAPKPEMPEGRCGGRR